MKILVTGGAGFIGSHLVAHLINDGHKVRIIDNLTTGKLENIEPYLDEGQLEFIKGDIREVSLVKNATKGIDAVVHLAAIISVPLSISNPNLTYDVNDAKIKPITEDENTNPISPYAESKLIGECYCLGLCERQLIQYVVLRLFNVYGPRQSMNEYSGVISRFISNVRANENLTIYGDGSQTRDFVNVSDVVQAFILALNKEIAIGRIFNIGSGKYTSINEVANEVLELTNADLYTKYAESRAGDIKDSYADITRSKRLLNYQPNVSLREGLEAIIRQG